MMKKLSASAYNQLEDSIDKLFHYLAVYVKQDTTITVRIDEGRTYERVFKAPRQVSISPTLYTRIDDCHGAGNCCRVPFDLVYTGFDRSRIEGYDYGDAVEVFGADSAEGFQRYQEQLLERLIPLGVTVAYTTDQRDIQTDLPCNTPQDFHTTIWVQINSAVQPMSGNKSCPYLIMSDDRYFCGVHPFKPLHCWYPHMTVRVTEPRATGDRPTVSIGRMQYGRNHKFGCPVEFIESQQPDNDGLFPELQVGHKLNYFDEQFDSDYAKLEWTSNSAESMGFDPEDNFCVGIHDHFKAQEMTMRRALAAGKPQPITLSTNQ